MTTALLTDQYELTMLRSALRDGTWSRHCVFEVFTRRLPPRRGYGVVAGTGRLLDMLAGFRFDAATLEHLQRHGIVDDETAAWLADYRFAGDIDGYPEGELYFPGSPVLTVSGTFAEAVVLETLALSVLNHDSAIASAASRMTVAAGGRPIIEMGSRRTHEWAAVASARASYVAGFDATSNLQAGLACDVPTAGTSAHAFTLLHDSERAAFEAQVAALGVGTTLLVDTYDIRKGIQTAVEVAGPELGAVRIDSGDLGVLARQARAELDELGATSTRIVVSGDLDEYAIAALAAAPVDVYGAGTAVVTGSGAPTAGMVYKLVEVDGRPVAKRSLNKATQGGRKHVVRRHRPTGVATEEVLVPRGHASEQPYDLQPQVALVRSGERVHDETLAAARQRHQERLGSLPWEGLSLAADEPAIPTVTVAGTDR